MQIVRLCASNPGFYFICSEVKKGLGTLQQKYPSPFFGIRILIFLLRMGLFAELNLLGSRDFAVILLCCYTFNPFYNSAWGDSFKF